MNSPDTLFSEQSSVNSVTEDFYETHAIELAERYSAVGSAPARLFSTAFTPGSHVLDVGCGSGRDLAALLDAGYDGAGVDGSEAMLREAVRRYPVLAGRMSTDTLPLLVRVQDGTYDGVLCWAVLMHVPEEQLFDTVFNLRRVLKPGGRLLISTPLRGPEVDSATCRDADGRLFNGVVPESFRFLLEKVGFRLLERRDQGDSLGRVDRIWATQLFALEGAGSRSLDRIESILNRDKKDATYKPALFRALAELATTSYHAATWLPEGKVAIPLDLIADKWVEYFWPLFESATFIPQKRGERPGCAKPIAFRAEMDALIGFYRITGGLGGFSVDYRSNSLPAGAKVAHRRLRAAVSNTIRVGPVHYAGGGGSGTFAYDPISRSVVMDADLWRELSVMGAWIGDATVLRWAELTAEISQGALRPSQVIDQLLTPPILERDVQAARSFYQQLADKVCVWTDRSLCGEFDVDHAIPFALWRNNDLWNLLPASPTVNNEKRDRLPALGLLRSSKERIVGYWGRMRERFPVRFEFEAGKLAGPAMTAGRDWENRLFGAVVEAVEFTAIQRGVERWEPNGGRRLRRAAAVDPEPERKQSAAHGGHAALKINLLQNPPAGERFVSCVPFYELEAAAGAFGPEQPAVDPQEHQAWMRVSGRRLTKDMFALRVVGQSMEPMIPDGAVCLFRGGEALAGTREGRIVLVSLRNGIDPDTGGRLTVKRYHSEKCDDEDAGVRHVRVELRPINPAYNSILLQSSADKEVCVVGEFLGVTTPELTV